MPNKYDKINHKFVNTLKTNKSQELITNVIKKRGSDGTKVSVVRINDIILYSKYVFNFFLC